ncbi:MAG: SirB2 family protein [Phycisphaeraceae bacterium]
MSTYLLLRAFHITCAVLSAGGFLLRGLWMLADSPLLRHRLARVLPHVIDTLLLASAIALVIMSGFYPLTTSWINIKLVLLVVYIVFGSIALKRGRSRRLRAAAFVLALASVTGIFAAAVFKP